MILELKGIYKEYLQGKMKVPVLKDVNFSMEEGEYVAIMGPSGSGKTTLMNIIGVLDRQTEGTYFLEGKDVNKMDDSMRSAIRNKRIGFVFQNFNLLPKANALKKLSWFRCYIVLRRKKTQKERAMEMLKMVGMEERAFT